MTKLIPFENESIARNFIFGFKSSLLMLQTFLVMIIIITREEYIYRSIDNDLGTSSNEYETAELITIISSSVFFVFLLLEFFVILVGISTKFLKASSFQILFHFWGWIISLFIVIDRMGYMLIVTTAILFGLIPFLIELFVLFYYYFQRKIQQNYIQRPGQRTNLSREEVIRRKKIEEKNIKRSRGQNMNEEMAEVKEQRRKEGRDIKENENPEDGDRIEDEKNPFQDDDGQFPREERKDDPYEDEKYEEDEYHQDNYPRNGPSLNRDRGYSDDGGYDDGYSRSPRGGDGYSRSPRGGDGYSRSQGRHDDYSGSPRRHDDSRSPRGDSYGYSENDRPRGRSGSPEESRPSRPEDRSRGVDLD